MKNNAFLRLLLLLAVIATLTHSKCNVCANCTTCAPEVIADNYLDQIDALMQGKVQNLGYPLTIARNVTSTAITYQVQYSSGLLIVLQLTLSNMQIQLLSYSVNSNAQTAATTTYATTQDGYYIITNFTGVREVSEIMSYLGSMMKDNMTNFNLIGVQFTNKSSLLYRLKFQVIPISSKSNPVVQEVLVQYVGPKNCLLIDSNYSSLSSNITYTSVNPSIASSDVWLESINSLLVKKYGNLLGNNPSMVSIDVALPYYKIVYLVGSSNYSFIILYDYFQNRIIQGNLTIYKLFTYTQAQTTPAGADAAVVTSTTTTTTTSPSSIASTSSSSSSSSSSLSSSSTSSSSVSAVSTTTSASSSSALAASATTASAGGSSTSSSSISSSPTTTSTTTSITVQASSYQQIAHFQTNSEVRSTVSFLSSLGQNISMSQVQSVEKSVSESTTFYRISILLASLGQLDVSTSTIFYQYIIQLSPSGQYSVSNASYISLNPPNFKILNLEEVKSDANIKLIARFLLSQKFPMLSTNSRVLAVYRDVPYYQLIFQGPGQTQITFVILYNFNGSIEVMSATSRQVPSAQSNTVQQSTQTIQSTTAPSVTVSSQVQTSTQAQTQVQSSTTASSISQATQAVQSQTASQVAQQQSQSSQQATQLVQPVQPILQQQATSVQNSTVSAQAQQTATSQPAFVQIKKTDSKDKSQAESVQANTVKLVSIKQGQTTTQTTQTAQTQTVNVPQNPLPKTATNSTQDPTQVDASLSGFTHFSGPSDQLYSYAIQGMSLINQTLSSKGYQTSDLIYRDIVYRLDGITLTILFKVQADGMMFSYQYKGSLGSSYALTNTTTPSAIQTSSDSQNYDTNAKTILSGGVTYQLASTSLTSQSYIQSYLNFLQSNDICYSRANLVGIYVSSVSPNTLMFRFKNSTQFYNIVTNTVEIQRILSIYLSDSKKENNQATVTTQSTKGTQATQSTSTSATAQSTQTTQTSTSSSTSSAQSLPLPTPNTQSTTSQASSVKNQSTISLAQTLAQSLQSTQSSSQRISITKVDAHCLCYDLDKCLKCAHRFYLSNNQCIQVPNECLSYDTNTGVCVKCLPGYSLQQNGQCRLDDVIAYYYENQCFQCLGDYRLVSQRCVYAPSTDPASPSFLQTKNPLCLSWDRGLCTECLPGTFLSTRNICELVDPLCLIFDYSQQVCNTCIKGHNLRNGKCFKSQ